MSDAPSNIDPQTLAILEEKLAFYQQELSRETDHRRRFQLQWEIHEIKAELGIASEPPKPPPLTRFDTSRLPTPGPLFIGRNKELAQLDKAWDDTATPENSTTAVTIVAWGGVGKSALLDRWITTLASQNWRTGQRDLQAEAVFVWSFYSQGTEERLTSADAFMEPT